MAAPMVHSPKMKACKVTKSHAAHTGREMAVARTARGRGRGMSARDLQLGTIDNRRKRQPFMASRLPSSRKAEPTALALGGDAWFSAELVEFVDHAPGTAPSIANKSWVRRADGTWEERRTPGTEGSGATSRPEE